MKLKINQDELKKMLSQATFHANGDDQEKLYDASVTALFPKCEEYWRTFVVPLTRRIENPGGILGTGIHPRDGVDPKLLDISSAHYSMFMHLAYAHWHYIKRVPSWLEDVYTHLVSACDLAEAVIEKWYLLLLKCQDKKSKDLQGQTREEVMAKAGEWYDKHYASAYEYYYSKGKSKSLDLLKGENHEYLLDEYFGDAEAWKEYARFTNMLRPYRNAVVHDVRLAILFDPETKNQLIPKLDKINGYRTWRSVHEVAGKQEIIDRDFAEIGQQIKESIDGLEIRLNDLWGKLIQDFVDEFFSTERDALRNMYEIEISDARGIFVTGRPQDKTVQDIPYTTESGMYRRVDSLNYIEEKGSAIYPLSRDNISSSALDESEK